jgi:hypothetical protein
MICQLPVVSGQLTTGRRLWFGPLVTVEKRATWRNVKASRDEIQVRNFYGPAGLRLLPRVAGPARREGRWENRAASGFSWPALLLERCCGSQTRAPQGVKIEN